jgi:hypothetical protein
VDAGSADNERRESVRQKRVVLTPVVWRQVPGKFTLPRSDGGNRASTHRGERAISRKAIAQGMSDVLRCPVCSCAYSLLPSHTRSRVQRASGIPCALCLERAKRSAKLRAQCAARTRRCIPSASRYEQEFTSRRPGLQRGPITTGRSFAKGLCYRGFNERSRGMGPPMRNCASEVKPGTTRG